MNDLKLKDLRYLVALGDTRHFGRAAALCHVSQPTLSAQLKKLEEYLGVKLVERQPRRVTLTEAGLEVAARARRILHDGQEIIALARHEHDPLSGKLRMALIPTIAPYLLPHIAPKIHRAAPKLQLLLFEYRTANILEKLRQGELDMGILALPVEMEGLQARPLYEEPFTVAAPSGHPLSKMTKVRPEDLNGETVLLLEDGHCLREQALEVCNRAEAREQGDFRGTSLETLRQMVAAGLGVTLLPEMAARSPFGNPRSLTVLPFARPAPTRTVGAVWRKSSTRRAAIEAVCDTIEKTVKDMP